MINKEQTDKLKNQIIQQIQSWDKPENQKQQAIQQIQSMNPQQLEQFLIQNNMIQSTPSQTNPSQSNQQLQQCPFCLISQGKIKSYKIAENNYAIAVLEINPVSKGHTLIIPKQHLTIEKVPVQTFQLAQQVIQLLKQKLSPKQVQLSTGQIQEHSILNIIPLTGNEKGERKKVGEKDLQELQNLLTESQPKQKQKKTKSREKLKKLPQVKRRVP